MLTHCFLGEFQGGFLIARLCHEAFQNFAFMIDGPPKIMSLTVDLHEHLVQMPAPPAGFQTLDPPFLDLRSKHRTEPMSPKSNDLVAHVDAALVEQIFHIA